MFLSLVSNKYTYKKNGMKLEHIAAFVSFLPNSTPTPYSYWYFICGYFIGRVNYTETNTARGKATSRRWIFECRYDTIVVYIECRLT